MSALVTSALANALRQDPGRPLVTFYDGATGERIELSVQTFENWVCKVANLLSDELMLERGVSVSLDLPTHWQSAVVVMGAWVAGLHVVEPGQGPSLAVVGPSALATALTTSGMVLATSLRPMGGAFVEDIPVGWLDFAREVPPQPDALLVDVGLDEGDLAVVLPAGPLTHAELASAGMQAALDLGISTAGRLLTDANPGRGPGLIVALVAPLMMGGSVVLVVNTSAQDRAAIARQEATTTSHWTQ